MTKEEKEKILEKLNSKMMEVVDANSVSNHTISEEIRKVKRYMKNIEEVFDYIN